MLHMKVKKVFENQNTLTFLRIWQQNHVVKFSILTAVVYREQVLVNFTFIQMLNLA